VWANIASIPAVGATPVANTTIASTSTSTIRATSARQVASEERGIIVGLKVGMRNFHVRKNATYCPTLNVDKLWSLVTEETRLHYKEKTDKAPVIDIVRHGYHKV
jgi:hypothetical protein